MVESIKELKEICQKKGEKGYVSAYSYAHRYVSIYFTWLFLHTPITANQVSLLNVLLVFVSGIFFFQGTTLSFVIGILIWYLIGILDRTDGEIARYRKQTSIVGEYIDGLMHLLQKLTLFFCVGFAVYTTTGHLFYLVVALIALLFSQAISIISQIRLRLTPEMKVGKKKVPKKKSISSIIHTLITIPQGYFKEFFLLFALFIGMEWFILFFALYYIGYFLLYATVSGVLLAKKKST